MCFTSSAGQTYFIGIFGPGIRADFGLSHTEWGSLYMIGTLISAILLPWSGQLLDRIDLRAFAVATLVGLAVACTAISQVNSVWFIVVAVFLLRQFGQGLTSLTGSTSMARYFDSHRGKAIAVSSMGFSVGEAILPVSAVIGIAALGWRDAYLVTALGVLAIIPIALCLLRGQSDRDIAHSAKLQRQAIDNPDSSGYTRRQVLAEKRFYLMTPALMLPSMIGTALFFHHLTLAEHKGWSAEWVTGNYGLYAFVTIATSLGSGPIIDRFSATKVMPWFLMPMVAALIIVGPAQSHWLLIPYMICLGLNTGLYFTGSTAMWAELYGAKYLGAIKSLMTALTVFASAIGPVTVGVMLDSGFSMRDVCFAFAALCVLFTVPFVRALR